MHTRGRHVRRSSHSRLLMVGLGVVLGSLGFGIASSVDAGVTSGSTGAPSGPSVLALTATSQPGSTTTEPTTTTTAPEPTTTTAPPPRRFSMLFTGDLLIHSGVTSRAASHATEEGRAFDFRPFFEPIRPLVERVDWAVCHLEVNLSAANDRLSSYPRFRAPGQLAGDVRDIGFDACTTASNHTMDHGADGVVETLGVLEDAGLRFTGSARSPDERRASRVYDIGGVRVHHLSYTYWFNGLSVPEDKEWMSQAIDRTTILAEAAEARASGAEFVVVSLHWGEQYQTTPNAQQRELGPDLLASPDIDLIIGHHAHVVQPIERIGDEWLVYGLGNLISGDQRTLDELAVTVDVMERPAGGFVVEDLTATPLYLAPDSLVVTPVPADADDPRLRSARERIASVLQTGSGWRHLEFDPVTPAG